MTVANTTQQEYQLFIGGQFVPAASKKTFKVTNPATGEVIAQVASADAQDVNQAVKAAKEAFPGWSALSPGERAAHLFKLADLIEQNLENLAQLESQNAG